MNKARSLRVLAGVLLCLGWSAPARAADPQADRKKAPEYVYYADAVLLRWVSKIIHQRGLTARPDSALVYLCGTSEDGTYREVEVREKKGSAGPLDPNAGRRLFAVRIDLQSGALVTDALRFDGKVYPGEAKYRLLLPGIKRPRR